MAEACARSNLDADPQKAGEKTVEPDSEEQVFELLAALEALVKEEINLAKAELGERVSLAERGSKRLIVSLLLFLPLAVMAEVLLVESLPYLAELAQIPPLALLGAVFLLTAGLLTLVTRNATKAWSSLVSAIKKESVFIDSLRESRKLIMKDST